ncbi:unnamed protein product, partial [Timema podura]|nr:unnamed protein product [Timema podura]
MVYFSKPTMKVNSPEKLSRLEARVQLLELAGPSGRRLERKLSCNLSGDMVLVWWRCARDEVYPWSPIVKDQDRANVHVYSVSGYTGSKTRCKIMCLQVIMKEANQKEELSLALIETYKRTSLLTLPSHPLVSFTAAHVTRAVE